MPSAVPQRGVRIEDTLYDKLRALAVKDNRSFNQEVVYILRLYLDQYENEHGEIRVPEEEWGRKGGEG